jgi:hypothetical protein
MAYMEMWFFERPLYMVWFYGFKNIWKTMVMQTHGWSLAGTDKQGDRVLDHKSLGNWR